MSDNIEYVYPIGYGIKKIRHELIYDENEEYESGDCYSGDEDDDDDYLFQNSSALKDLPVLIQLKAYYTKLSAGLHGRYTNSYVYDPRKPQQFGQKLKLWIEDTDGNFIELYFINETSDINTKDKPWRGYDYSNDHTLQKYTQEKNILDHNIKSTDLNWTELKGVNVKLEINNIRDLLSRIKHHYEIRNKLKLEARNSHIKLDIQKLKKDKLYRVLPFPYTDNVTKQKKIVNYQIIKIWTTDENPYYTKMYYVMAGTNDKMYGRWIGVKVEDQEKSNDPINDNDLIIIKARLIEGFDVLKIKDHDIPSSLLKDLHVEATADVSYIHSGINNLLKKIAEHYYLMTHPPHK